MNNINLKMLALAIENLPRPKYLGERREIRVESYLGHLKRLRLDFSSSTSNDLYSYSTITLVAEVYKQDGWYDDLQWEAVWSTT